MPCLCERPHCLCSVDIGDVEGRLAEWLQTPTGRTESYFVRNPLDEIEEPQMRLDLWGLQERRRYVIVDIVRDQTPRWHIDLGYVGERRAVERAQFEAKLQGRTRVLLVNPDRSFSLIWDSLLED
jgi:hypothetical protein